MGKLSRGLEWLINDRGKRNDLDEESPKLEKPKELVDDKTARHIIVGNQKVLVLYRRH